MKAPLLSSSQEGKAFARHRGADGGTTYDHLARHIRRAIATGRWAPGEQLHLRETFRQDFDVSNTTIQKAFTRLAEDGFVVTRGRLGTFVAERPPNLCRVGLVFNRPQSAVLADKHCLALATAASAPDSGGRDAAAGKTLASYYGTFCHGLRDPATPLAVDLRAERLAGLVWIAPAGNVAPEVRALADGIPNVFCYTNPPNARCPMADRVATVLLTGFIQRAAAEMAASGGRRAAVLTLAPLRSQADEMAGALEREGVECRPVWRQGISGDYPDWAQESIQLLFSQPADQRPDSLVIADDNLAEAALSGLARLGLLGRVKVVCHANFPLLAPAPLPIRRVGYDCREVLRAALAALDRLRKDATALPHLEVPARAEHELPPDGVSA